MTLPRRPGYFQYQPRQALGAQLQNAQAALAAPANNPAAAVADVAPVVFNPPAAAQNANPVAMNVAADDDKSVQRSVNTLR